MLMIILGCNGICPACSVICPLDATNCPVCDAVLPERQLTPQVKLSDTGEVICPACNHPSPPNSKQCVRCELRSLGFTVSQISVKI